MTEHSCYISNGRMIFRKARVPRKSYVIKAMGTKRNTFAGNLISRLYSYYFDDAVNFKKEYRLFYRKEFSSITEFIEEHYNFEHDEAALLAAEDYSLKMIYSSVERNIETLHFDNDLMDAFWKVIGGMKDENQSRICYE